jgi:ribose transport system ATP-binding protein
MAQEVAMRSEGGLLDGQQTGPRQALAGSPLLSVNGVVKEFPGTVALRGVDLEVLSGEIHALLGENGAGKSVLIKILAGVYHADAGTIRLRGEPYAPGTGHQLAFIHQDLGLFPSYSVAENIAIIAGYPRRRGLISWPRVRENARGLLASMGSSIDPDESVLSLRPAERSILAIARALALKADVLILDEPTASLPETDVRHLLSILTGLRDRGTGIIFVTHRLDEVFRLADRVTVLRDGVKISTQRVADTTPSRLVRDIVGRDLTKVFVTSPPPAPELALEVADLTVGPAGPVSFSVRRGEIIGLVGLRGAGQDLVGRSIFGETGDWEHSGTIRIHGRRVSLRGPAAAMSAGVGFVSSNRAEEGIAGILTIRENVYPNPVAESGSTMSVIHRNAERRRMRVVIHRFDIRPQDPERAVGTLSGGNQQKTILARWLEARSRVLVLEEPTFGVDIGAKAEIYSILSEYVAGGGAVVLVSSDFEEVVGIAHRALVFRHGVVVEEVPQGKLTVKLLTELASGASGGESEDQKG